MIESPKNFIEQFQNFIEHIAGVMKTFLTKEVADNYYLGKTAKAVNAGAADKAARDANNNVITSTYATKTEVTSGLSGKLGKTEKASSASTADAVAWTGVSGKPNFATVATSGSYNDLKDKPSIAKAWYSTSSTPIYRLFRVSRTDEDSYTATSDCFIDTHIEAKSATFTDTYIYINGIDYASALQDMKQNRIDDSLYVFLQKGKSITGRNKYLSGTASVRLHLYIYPLA